MTNSEIQNILIKLQRATCCGKLKVVDELPEGNLGNGFVVFEDGLYYWDGDEWIVVGGGGALPTFKTINGETIDDGPGDIVVGGTGLETLDEGNGFGWRLVGRNAANYGDIGENGVDFSFQDGSSTTLGAVGEYSTAFGLNTWASGSRSMVWGQGATASAAWSTAWGAGSIASGLQSTAWGNTTQATQPNATAWGNNTQATNTNSTAWGNFTIASGESSTAWGGSSVASGYNSTAFGYNTTASQSFSTAFGYGTVASGYYSTAFGQANTASASNSVTWGTNNQVNSFCATVLGHNSTIGAGQNTTSIVSTDELFKIGNGPDAGNRSDAFLILKNGTITAPSLTNALITTAGNKALITKEYLDANAGSSSGLEALDEGNGFGWRLIGRNAANYGNIGNGAVDLAHATGPYNIGATGSLSFAVGYNSRASNQNSAAFGKGSLASGVNSIAFGLITVASGYTSTSLGRGTNSSGSFSIASGYYCTSSGQGSFTTNRRNVANSFASTVIGNYATVGVGQDPLNFVSTDELFKIGNGSTYGSNSDALTIYKNAVQKVGGITATAASALTPQAGMIAYVTSTDATFVTTGFWKYQGGAWTPF